MTRNFWIGKTEKGKTMNIIFVTLPKYLVPICILLRKIGYRVFYLKLAVFKCTPETEISWVEKLKHAGIIPLPLEELSCFKGFSEIETDHNMKAFKRTQQIAPIKFLQVFEKLFPVNTDITKRLQLVIQSMVASQNLSVTGYVNIWARAHPDINHLLIDISPNGWLTPELEPNVQLFVIPFDTLESGVAIVKSIIRRFLYFLKAAFRFKGKVVSHTGTASREVDQSRVAFVTHKGLKYGKILKNDVFFSARIDSELHPERLLYIDYSGFTSPSEKLKWVCLGNQRQSFIKNLYSVLVVWSKGILQVRNMRHIICLQILTNFYVGYKSFLTALEAYPNLKVALIDYEILCPKALLLAFESRGIRTIATQERFIFAFNNLIVSIILNDYLCNSQFAAEALKRSPLNCIDHYLPVGQYRSDNFFEAKKSPPPQILKAPISKGLRVITALGFHTHMEWQNSQADLLINWKAHQHFLDDMIRLSKEIPDVFIILRYKFVDWVSLPVFAETVQKIQSSHNMTISMNYDKSYFSYDLCAHSDLVIAKHTSLGDECLSVGIPVLFHEYFHNTERIVADAFDYTPARIMCFNYDELLERAKIILSGTPNAMTEDYEYLKNVVYGGLGDGKVRERIHAHIEKMLSEV